jgi:hypothetical protein
MGSVALVTAQAQQPGPRDATSTPQTGTAILAGTLVINDVSAQPIRNALVTLSGAPLTASRLATSDTSGHFEFDDLPPGRFTLTASHSGFVRDFYGSKRPGVSPGTPIAVVQGQHVNVTMKLTRSAVIAGTIILPPGAPRGSVLLQVLHVSTINGEHRLVPAIGGAFGVDGSGRYRMEGLAPDDYVLFAYPFSTTEVVETSADEIQWALRQSNPSMAGTVPVLPADRGPRMALSKVYYPGTTDPNAAVPIAVAAGEERLGVDFPLTFVPTATVSGVVLGPDELPAGGSQAILMPSGSAFVYQPPATLRLAADGSFSVTGVLPGHYVLLAQAGGASAAGGAPVASLSAIQDVEVSGRDVTSISVHLKAGVSVSGRLAFESATLPPPKDLTSVQLSLTSALPPGGMTFSVLPVQAAADGTFVFASVPPGSYRLSAVAPTSAGAIPAWTLKSSIVGGKDSQDDPFEVIAGRDTSGAVVTLSDRHTEINGTITDSVGRPAPELIIVAFATDSRFWTYQSRRVVQARPGTTGHFVISGLPPGEYYLCALTALEPAQLSDRAFLEQIIGASVRISLAEGEQKTQDLRIAGTLLTSGF